MKKSFLLGALALISLGAIAPAVAADLPARPYSKAPEAFIPALYDWSGFYLGLNGGWGTANRCFDQTAPVVGTEGCHTTSGGFAGAQLGYRWETGPWVWGLEAQGDWSGLKGSNISLVTPADTNRSRIDAFGLFTGQVGYAWNTTLLYFKGGAAVIADHNNILAAGAVLASPSGETRWGGTVGGGIEFSFAPNWSAAFEYNHLFIANATTTFTNVNSGAVFSTDRIHGDADLVSVRVNYRWGGPVVGKY
ncbi:outer membrane protein [Bradyrhizobium sp.]|uniref:outer membrane protein n=1 Tax=Bradyrhizobium sp. TaxID=376 RepID=UPI002D7FB1F7|nr:outer membrane beta-barrel protein [Bradyrhizobium sp.]